MKNCHNTHSLTLPFPPTHTRKHAAPLGRPSQHVADGVAHLTPFNIQVGPDDFVHIVTSYAHHYDG